MADGFDDDLFNVFDGAEAKQQQSTPKGKDVPKSDIARYGNRIRSFNWKYWWNRERLVIYDIN